jgi:hypothetical protein
MNRSILLWTRIALIVAALAVALTAGSPVTRAQTIYMTTYFSNANTPGAPDATAHLWNPGASPNTALTDSLDLCALIYVFDANQQMSECCGCFVSANGLLTLSVNKDLTSNPLLGTRLHTGVIEVLADFKPANPPAPGNCDPTDIQGSGSSIGLEGDIDHIHNKVGTTFPITEEEFHDVPLFPTPNLLIGQAVDLPEDCTVLRELGSGAGRCTCPPGAH